MTFCPAERRLRPRVPTVGWRDRTEFLAQAPGRAAKGPREQGVGLGTRGRWARGSHSITPTPKPSSGASEPTDTQTWPWGHPCAHSLVEVPSLWQICRSSLPLGSGCHRPASLPLGLGEGLGFDPWSRKISHATEQLSLCTTATEPVPQSRVSHSSRAHTRQLLKPTRPRACAPQQETP